MPSNEVLRQQILKLLGGGNAHMPFDSAVADFPMQRINERPPSVPYTPWHLLEHMRISQWDVLEFMRDPDFESPAWPLEYWPAREAVAEEADWFGTIEGFQQDMADIQALAADPQIDMTAEIPHAPGYTYLREFLIVADHNAYHIGEFAILRQVMGTWPEGRGA